MGLIFGQLGTKIFGSLSLFLAVLLSAAFFVLHLSENKVDKLVKTNAAIAAERDQLIDANQAMVDAGKVKGEAVKKAIVDQQSKSAKLQADAARIRSAKPSADCTTPKEIMEASGL